MHFAHGNQKRLTYGADGSAPALGAEKVLPTRLSLTLVFIVFNNLGNLLLVQS
jgi:hypothetical protein